MIGFNEHASSEQSDEKLGWTVAFSDALIVIIGKSADIGMAGSDSIFCALSRFAAFTYHLAKNRRRVGSPSLR